MLKNFAVSVQPKNVNPCVVVLARPLLVAMQHNEVVFRDSPLEVDALTRNAIYVKICASPDFNAGILRSNILLDLNNLTRYIKMPSILHLSYLLARISG